LFVIIVRIFAHSSGLHVMLNRFLARRGLAIATAPTRGDVGETFHCSACLQLSRYNGQSRPRSTHVNTLYFIFRNYTPVSSGFYLAAYGAIDAAFAVKGCL